MWITREAKPKMWKVATGLVLFHLKEQPEEKQQDHYPSHNLHSQRLFGEFIAADRADLCIGINLHGTARTFLFFC